MFTLTSLSQKAQQAVCLMLSAVIVTASLAIGAYTAERAADNGYSVTVTQIQ